MGCPPDPIEVSLWRGNDNSKALKEKADLLIPQAKHATNLFYELCCAHEGKVSPEQKKTASQLQKDASRYTSEHLGKTFNWSDFPEEYGGYPNMSAMSSHLTNSETYVKKIEIALCITRDLYLKAVDLIGEANLSREESEAYQLEKALHLAHRREDKEIVVNQLKSDIETCHFVMTTTEYNYTDEEKKEYTEKLNKLEPELKRIEAITDDELLIDRELF